MKLNKLLTFGLVSATVAPALIQCTEKKQDTQPNILFILLDDAGYADLGYMGQKLIETPHIDALAKESKVFTQHYSAAAVSAPARCGLLTGLNGPHAQIRGNDELDSRGNVWSYVAMAADSTLEGQAPMAEGTVTIANMLQRAGYTTACIGKWGLGAPGSSSEPNAVGFDFFYGTNCQRLAHDYYTPHLYRNTTREYTGNKPREMGGRLAEGADIYDEKSYEEFTSGIYSPELLRNETLAYLERVSKDDKPFFLWWTTALPHAALAAPDRWVKYYVEKFGDEEPFLGDHYFPVRYPNATAAAMISYIDEQVGEMVAKLKELGEYENTIIVFTSDNGPSWEGGKKTELFESASPYSSASNRIKTSLYEGGINVPMFVHYPKGGVQSGTTELMSYFADWMPTLMDMAGVDMGNYKSDGVSLVPELTGKGKMEEREYLVWEMAPFTGVAAIRDARYKLMVRYIANEKRDLEFELYDLIEDKKELNNLYGTMPEVEARLKTALVNAHTEPLNKNFSIPMSRILE